MAHRLVETTTPSGPAAASAAGVAATEVHAAKKATAASDAPVAAKAGAAIGAGAAAPVKTAPPDISCQHEPVDQPAGATLRLTSDERFRLMVDSAGLGFWAIDEHNCTNYVNRRMCEIIGYDAKCMVGRPVADFVFAEDIPAIRKHMRQRRAGVSATFEGRYRHGDGTERILQAYASPIFSAAGNWCGAGALMRDVTEERRRDALTSAVNDLYKEMIDNAVDLIYTADADGHFTYLNPTAVRYLKYPEERLLQMTYGELVRPDHRRRIERFYALQNARRTARSYCEFPVLTSEGQTIWFGQHVHLLQDGDTVQGFQAMARDITERKLAETQLRESEERLNRLVDASFEAVFLTENGIIIDVNGRACQMFGYSSEELIGQSGMLLVAPSHRNYVRETAAAGREEMYLSRCQRKDGSEFSVEVRARSTPWQGHIGRIAVIRDITDRQRYEEEIEHQRWQLQQANEGLRASNLRLTALATTDGLTGLKNHRAFQEALANEWSRSQRYNLPLSLLLLDVDNFKGFNDSFGHPAGDEVLRRAAAVLAANVRDIDMAARYGGEEFAILQPNTSGPDSLIQAERIRKAIAAERWSLRPVTVSVGAAATLLLRAPYDEADLSEDRHTAQELVQRADRALYLSKAAGRNCVHLADEA